MNLNKVNNFESMLKYFSDELDWPMDLEYLEEDDITFEYEPEEIGLSEDYATKIESIKQIRPLVDEQPWGIFYLKFQSKRLPVTALRKILSSLIPSKRKKSEYQATWNKEDLIFICIFGEHNSKSIGLAYFKDSENLPILKTIYWNSKEETNYNFEEDIKKLKWPEDVYDLKNWKLNWASAFNVTHQKVIKDSIALSQSLAKLANNTKELIKEVYNVETKSGYLHKLHEKFRNILIHDLELNEFADMYAQTVAYGLFSARCICDETDFQLNKIIDLIPSTNPLLKGLLSECFSYNNKSKLNFDELEIGEIVELLKNIDINSILRDFNRRTGGGMEDPVIHFYEGFLTEYEHEQKKRRGVYYTPDQVVDFMVRAVDDILREDFGHIDGLADTSTKKIKILRDSKRRNSRGFYEKIEDFEEVPAIQILDPATGTGTFLRHIILNIKREFDKKYEEKNKVEIKTLWNAYVTEHLLPRINGFEIMMAPYSVAHMKLGLTLKETGYTFKDDRRINVLLTSALEYAGNSELEFLIEGSNISLADPLSHESYEANSIKNNKGINIVIGNPPYNISSVNKNEWISDLLNEYKINLNEKKLNLDDDYIKFIRYGQKIVGDNGLGVLCFITNNSFIDGITHRQMRKSLMDTFNKVYIIDLHGNSMKQEKTETGDNDENVFDIQQGVSINIFIKNKEKSSANEIFHFDLYGDRNYKYNFLLENNLKSIIWNEVNPVEPEYFFVPKNYDNKTIYQSGFKITELLHQYISGIQTKCDALSVHYKQSDLESVLNDFKNLDEPQLKKKYHYKKDSSGWSFIKAKKDILNDDHQITKYYYRPFDVRYTVYTGRSGGFIGRSRESVMKHMIQKENLALCLMRQFFQHTTYNHVFISDIPIDERTLYSNRGGTYIFPLYLYSWDENSKLESRSLNFNWEIIKNISNIIGMNFDIDNSTDTYFNGEDVIYYIYAVLYSGHYRNKYNEFLKYDFPYIPYPINRDMFIQLRDKGRFLVQLHLSQNFIIDENDCECEIILESYRYDKENKKIILNADYIIHNVVEDIWNAEIGGYQPAQKWLKDRRNTCLTKSAIQTYKKIINTIDLTLTTMKEIDNIMQSLI